MRNTIILSVILFLAVIAATIYYFKNLDNNHNQSARPLRFIPDNALFVAAIGNDKTAETVFKDFEILDAFIGFEEVKLWADFRNRILNQDKLYDFVSGSDIFISFHPEKKKVETLFTIPTSKAILSTDFTGIINALSTDFKVSTIDTLGQTVYQIKYGEKDSLIHAIYYKDILFASSSISLLTKITNKHSKHLSDDQIDFFLKNHTRKTPLSIYFPHQQYDSIIDITQRNKQGVFINMFKKLQGQSAWDINFKNDALILTGESQLDQYSENYASIFKNQQKRPQYLYTYFPSNTAIYAEFSLSNRATFERDLQSLFKRRKEKIAEEVDTSKTPELVSKALGDQFAVLETNAQNYIGFIHIKDKNQFQLLTKNIAESTSDSTGRFSKNGILYKYYGDVFKEFQRPYYTVVDSILVVANSQSTLKDYNDSYAKNDLLTGTLGFIKLQKTQGNEANVTLFAHARNANSILLNSLEQPFRDNFKNKDQFGYQDFFSWSIQLSGNNGAISSQIYAIYKSETILGTTAEWTVQFTEKAITQPFVFTESDTSQLILIQELNHTIHAISPKGDKKWSKVFAGRVLGDIKQLDDRTLVFVTDKNNFYRIQTDGKTVERFPINLPQKPSGSPMLTTINGQKIVLIPTIKTVYAYDMTGKTYTPWTNFEGEGAISTALLKHNNTYLFGTSAGKIYILDENGRTKKSLSISNESIKAIQVREENQIASVDNKGVLTVFYTEGEKKQWSIAADTENFDAVFERITTSSTSNLAVINGNKLRVIDIKDSLSTAFEYQFTKSIENNIQLFRTSDNKNQFQLGIASKDANLLYIFDEKGHLEEGFPVEGQPLFYYGKINYNADIYLLCMRRDKKLYAFRQQK